MAPTLTHGVVIDLLCTKIISVTNAETPQLPPKLSTLLVLIKAQKPIKRAPFHFVYVYNSLSLSLSLSPRA